MTQHTKTRGNAAMHPVGAILREGADFVWEAKARAEAAAARRLAEPEQVVVRTPPKSNAEAEAMVLALMARFGCAPDTIPAREPERPPAPAPAREPARAPAPVPTRPRKLRSGSFACKDDSALADPTWLHFELAGVPHLSRSNLRVNAAKDRYPRGVWRAAMAGLMRRPPMGVINPGGLLITAARDVARCGIDPRLDPRYCAQPGWGPKAYAVAGVQGLIHMQGGCRCE